MLAYIGLGSNLDNPRVQLERAINSLSEIHNIEIISLSSFYQSKPLLDIPGPNYINSVCKIETKMSALELLEICQQIEDKQDRVREVKWGSRTIDLDILLYGDQVIANDRLNIPHPEMTNRAFVLIPLLEIEEALKVPLLGPIKALVKRIDISDLIKL